MGVGYTLMQYDTDSMAMGIGDIGACQYDGLETSLPKVRHFGADQLRKHLAEFDLTCYGVMGEWLQSEESAERVAAGTEMAAAGGAELFGILPPQRGRVSDETFEHWLTDICEAAVDAGLTPVLHHHGATKVERPTEIETWLDRAPDALGLLFDTAHYYPYSDSYPDPNISRGIERFADDIAYIHYKDIEPSAEFDQHVADLSNANFNLDSVINYFRSFTDLGEGILEFDRINATLDKVDYDGHVTIEIEDAPNDPLVHAKRNLDFYHDH